MHFHGISSDAVRLWIDGTPNPTAKDQVISDIIPVGISRAIRNVPGKDIALKRCIVTAKRWKKKLPS